MKTLLRYITFIIGVGILTLHSCGSSSSSEKKSNCPSSDAQEFMIRSLENKGWTIEDVDLRIKDETNCSFTFRVTITGLGCKYIVIRKNNGEHEFEDMQDYR